MCRTMPKTAPQQKASVKFKGRVLVLLEHQKPRSFGAHAPQFRGGFAFGGTKSSTLRLLRQEILDEIDDAAAEDPSYTVPKSLAYSDKEAEQLRTSLASKAETNVVSISHINF